MRGEKCGGTRRFSLRQDRGEIFEKKPEKISRKNTTTEETLSTVWAQGTFREAALLKVLLTSVDEFIS